jgi:hypothetical protein
MGFVDCSSVSSGVSREQRFLLLSVFPSIVLRAGFVGTGERKNEAKRTDIERCGTNWYRFSRPRRASSGRVNKVSVRYFSALRIHREYANDASVKVPSSFWKIGSPFSYMPLA